MGISVLILFFMFLTVTWDVIVWMYCIVLNLPGWGLGCFPVLLLLTMLQWTTLNTHLCICEVECLDQRQFLFKV